MKVNGAAAAKITPEAAAGGSAGWYVAAASADDRDQFTVPAGTVVVAVGRLPIRKAATVEIECA